LELSELRLHEAIEGSPAGDWETLLLMVGRGSGNGQAIEEMRRFSRLRSQRRRLGGVETCFLARATPSLTDGLTLAAESPFRQIVVQCHLLFHGELVAQVEEETTRAAARHADRAWVFAGPLSPHPLLVQALADRSGLLPHEPPRAIASLARER
jgi:sirohydrochlorin ferrochelatase